MTMSDFPRLQLEHAVIRLRGSLAPPFATAMTWSTCKTAKGGLAPQYMQVK